MSGGLQSFLRTDDTRIGWRRIGVLLSLTIITIAGIVLYRMLREINFEDVIDAVEAVEYLLQVGFLLRGEERGKKAEDERR